MLNKKGVTLLELMLVVTIIGGILVFIGVPNFDPMITYSKKNEVTQEIENIEYHIKLDLLNLDITAWNKVNETNSVELIGVDGKTQLNTKEIYYEIPKQYIESDWPGCFYTNKGNVFYSKTKLNVKTTKNKISKMQKENFDNKVLLKELIFEASELIETDYQEGWQAFSKTFELAKETYDNQNVDNDKLGRTCELLENAINNLVLKEEIGEIEPMIINQ